jgi:hypothetical protein
MFFDQISQRLMMCDGVVSKTGDYIPLSSSDKLVWCFIDRRVHHFKREGELCFDSLEFIALRTAVGLKTVERFVIKASKSKVLSASKRAKEGAANKVLKWFFYGFNEVTYVKVDSNGEMFVLPNKLPVKMSEYVNLEKYCKDKPELDEYIPVSGFDHLLEVPFDDNLFIPEVNQFEPEWFGESV